jgi:cytochrome bd-type quinol oxidase subunit 2
MMHFAMKNSDKNQYRKKRWIWKIGLFFGLFMVVLVTLIIFTIPLFIEGDSLPVLITFKILIFTFVISFLGGSVCGWLDLTKKKD